MVYLHTGPMGVHCACFFIARAGRAATPERNRSGNQPPILCILPLVAHQLASARKNPFPDRPDYQPNRAPKRPHATVNKFRILSSLRCLTPEARITTTLFVKRTTKRCAVGPRRQKV